MISSIVDFFSPATKFTDSIGDAIDKVVTSDEERLILRNKLVELQGNFELETKKITASIEHEITERWISDNNGSSLSKNVRPGTLIAVTLFTMVLVVADSYLPTFNVKESYVDLLGTLLLVMYPAYFTAREIGKGINVWTARVKK